MAACEESFEKKEQPKAATVISRRIFTKHVMLRVGALAACLCLLVTGIFGGVGLLKNQFGDATAPVTQSAPDLPLDHYPNGEVDYANMSMVEYMELFPDFLSYRYMPWGEGYAFAHVEILEKKDGYRKIERWTEGSGYQEIQNPESYQYIAYKCRVIEDAWNMFEPGVDIYILVSDYRTRVYLDSHDSILLRMRTGKLGCYENVSGDRFYADAEAFSLELLGFFPIEDSKVQTKKLENYLKINNIKLNYDGNAEYSRDPDYIYCKFSDVESIACDGMAVETAVANLRDVYERYQTGEYNYISVHLVSKMTYGAYCRMMEGTLTKEDFEEYGVATLGMAYAGLPPLFSKEFSLSDGTKFEIATRVEIPDSYLPMVLADIPHFEKLYTDENGVLNSKACVEAIQAETWLYSFQSILYTFATVESTESGGIIVH